MQESMDKQDAQMGSETEYLLGELNEKNYKTNCHSALHIVGAQKILDLLQSTNNKGVTGSLRPTRWDK